MSKPDELPHDAEAEAAVIGAMLLQESALFEVVDLVEANDFYVESHRIIFEQAVGLVHEGMKLDLVTLSSRLRAKDLSDRVGGAAFLSSLTDVTADVTNARFYAKIVKGLATKRKLIVYGRRVSMIAGGSADSGEALEEAMSSLLTITGTSRIGETRTISDAAASVVEEARTMVENPDLIGVKTGIPQLDDAVSLRHGKVCVLAGATSSGKTSFALQIADQVAQRGKVVGFFSLEMSSEEIAVRVLASGTNTDTRAIESKPTGEIVRRLEGHLPDLEGRSLYIDDAVDLNPFSIRAKARQLQMRHGLDLIIVDYLQLMTYNGPRCSREQEVSSMSRGMKLAAKSLGVPIVLLSQLSRKHLDEKREPELRDLRESGSIENDADVVMMVHRKLDKRETTLLIRKQRQGPLGRIDFDFDGSVQRFRPTGYYPTDGLDSEGECGYNGVDGNAQHFDEGDGNGPVW